MKKITIIAVFLIAGHIYPKPFYTQKEYENLSNEKYALEIELALLKEDQKSELDRLHQVVAELEKQISESAVLARDQQTAYEQTIEQLKSKITTLEKKLLEEQRLSSLKVTQLEKQLQILRDRQGDREKELLQDIENQKRHYLEEIDKLKTSLDQERKHGEEEIKRLENQLLEWKQLLESQNQKLDEIERQAKDMENALQKEIQEGNLRIKRLNDRLIINIDDKILFDSGSATLKPEVRKTLGIIAAILSRNKQSRIVIEGHTDNIPIHTRRFRDNWQLSTERALSVLNYILNETNINPVRISAQGFGEYHPVAPNDTRENRQLNRRVDIVILPND